MIGIYKDTGGEFREDDYEPVAVYDEGVWIVDFVGYEDLYDNNEPEDVLLDQIDGPQFIALDLTDNPEEVIERAREIHDEQDSQSATS